MIKRSRDGIETGFHDNNVLPRVHTHSNCYKSEFIPFAAHQEAVGRTKLSANQDVLLYNLQVIMIRTIGDDPVSWVHESRSGGALGVILRYLGPKVYPSYSVFELKRLWEKPWVSLGTQNIVYKNWRKLVEVKVQDQIQMAFIACKTK